MKLTDIDEARALRDKLLHQRRRIQALGQSNQMDLRFVKSGQRIGAFDYQIEKLDDGPQSVFFRKVWGTVMEFEQAHADAILKDLKDLGVEVDT
jgi:hypothetical protein